MYAVTNFIVYDRHYNRTMSSVHSDSTSKCTSFLNFIMEVQWYVCLKEQIHQQIVSNDGSAKEVSGLEVSDFSQTMQKKEDFSLSNTVTESETSFILADDSVARPYASTVSEFLPKSLPHYLLFNMDI